MKTICGWTMLLTLLVPCQGRAQVLSQQQIRLSSGLGRSAHFGSDVVSLGDLDNDGFPDLAVGTPNDDAPTDSGAVWLLFLGSDGGNQSVLSTGKIGSGEGSFPPVLNSSDHFGSSLATLDLDGDGVKELVVGAPGDDTVATDAGAVWVIYLLANGNVWAYQKITGALTAGDLFGSSLASIGDLDDDGTPDLAVGAPRDDDGNPDAGAIWILFMNPDGSVKNNAKISETQGGFVGNNLDADDWFGCSVTGIGDLDGDAVEDIAVGVPRDDDGGVDRGAVWLFNLTTAGAVSRARKISSTQGGFLGLLDNSDQFGFSLGTTGDIDGDSISELFVGANLDDDGNANAGAVWFLTLDPTRPPNATVKAFQKISQTQGGFGGGLQPSAQFGAAVNSLGDLDGNGIPELGVGTPFHNFNWTDDGAFWIVHLDAIPFCGVGSVLDAQGRLVDVLSINGRTGRHLDRVVTVKQGERIFATILPPPGGGSGKFVVHANFGVPDTQSLTPLPANIGTTCFPLIVSQGAQPAGVWNNLGRPNDVGTSKYIDGSLVANPPLAPAVFLYLPEGDAVHLRTGTTVTFQGVISNPNSPSGLRLSATNAVTLKIQ